MALKLVTAQEMRNIDNTTIHERGISGLELMERAGKAVVDYILNVSQPPRRVGIVAGKGNNAGDGLVVARLLAEQGVEVRLMLLTLGENLSEAGQANFRRLPPDSIKILDQHSVPVMQSAFEGCDLLVDAILGTGIAGPARGVFGEAIAAINSLETPVLSIDLPSGLHTDTGEAEGACVVADETIAIGLPKMGMLQGVGPSVCGTIVVADIGFPEDLTHSRDIKAHLITVEDASEALPERPHGGHKGTFGALLAIAGSQGMSGAAYLTTAAALRSGCGMVYAAMPAKVAEILASRLVEAIKVPIEAGSGHFLSHESWDSIEPYFEKVSAIALGPGIGTRETTARLVDEIVCLDLPLVIDADALNCLGEKVQYLTQRPAPTILTPHPGEMARLMGISTEEVQSQRVDTARRLASEAKVIVLLKGAETVVAEPGGNVFINPTGNNGMAKGGSGDVLTGLIGGFLAQGVPPLGAACAGAYLHGVAGDLARDSIGVRGMIARDILDCLPKALNIC